MTESQSLISEFKQDYTKHKECVSYFIRKLLRENLIGLTFNEEVLLNHRAIKHDLSKEYDYKEFEGYIKMSSELKNVEYGTEEYNKIREKYDYVIQLHYKNNDHHPEHFPNGIKDMSRVQKLEMLCDWLGAMKCRNSLDGFEKSMEINRKRFDISDEDYNWIYNLATDLLKGEIK